MPPDDTFTIRAGAPARSAGRSSARQQERADDVGRERQLDALRGARPLRRQHAGVVDQGVELAALGEEGGGEFADRVRAGDVAAPDAQQVVPGAAPRSPARTRSPLPESRTSRWTPAPASARISQAAAPRPELAPVMRYVPPVRSGVGAKLRFAQPVPDRAEARDDGEVEQPVDGARRHAATLRADVSRPGPSDAGAW